MKRCSILVSAAVAPLLVGFATTACSAGGDRGFTGHGGQGSGGSANGGQTSANGGSGQGGATQQGQGGATQGQGGSGQGGATGNGGQTSGNGGASNGGSSNGGGSSGGASAGGSSSGGATAKGGGSATGGGSTGGATSGGGASGSACPSNATWCNGFEDAALPSGAVYKLNGDPATPWTHDFEIDATQKNSGKSSLRVKSPAEASGAYKMLAVPSGGAAFWVRFYIRSDVDLGANDHNVFAYAAGSDDPNDSNNVEFAEDVGIAFNSHDDVRWPMNFGRLTGGGTKPFTLPKDTWHCIEVSFDGAGKVQKLFIAGTQQIDATGYPASAYTFKTFKFGYNSLHGTMRKLWYDDVAVAPTRVNCLGAP